MNKFKKACEELEGYLHKDAKGIALLSRVTRIGNEVRNELASAIDSKAQSDSTCQHHMERALKAASELSKVKSERHQHLDTIASLQCKVANYEKLTMQDEEGYVPTTLEITPKEVSRLVRDAMNDKQHVTHKVTKDYNPDSFMESLGGRKKLEHIAIQDSISNLSYPELAKLGRLVALYAIMQGHAIVTSTIFSSLYDPDHPETKAVESANRLFLRFLRPRCDFSEQYRQEAMYVESNSHPVDTPKPTS